MDTLLSLKNTTDDFEVEYDVLTSIDLSKPLNERQIRIINGLQSVEEQIEINQQRINEINLQIDNLTNREDGMDYMVAVGSGLLAGLIDSFWAGEFSFERGKTWSNEKVNNFVMKVAKKQGYNGDELQKAIIFLEDNFGAPSDSVTDIFGGSLQHHLRDFAHHPTLVGLQFSLLTQFTGKSYGTDKNGFFKSVDVKDKTYIGKNVREKFFFGTVFWFFHMVSDMAGSKATTGAGMGLPGPLLSLAKELSALPFFKFPKNKDGVKEFSLWISKLYNGTLLAEHDEKGKIIKESAKLMRIDLRAELGVTYELGRQTLPVILNESIVRGFYFIRRFATEIKEKDIKSLEDLERIDLDKIKPYKNRTIVRMLIIATGTFTVVDMADTTIRSFAKPSKFGPEFLSNFVLRVNFVGIGRLAIACVSDIKMGVEKGNLRNERIQIYNKQLKLINVKVLYKQADMWISAENAEKTIQEAYAMIDKTTSYYIESIYDIQREIQKIEQYVQSIEQNNPGLISDINDILKWG